MNTYTVVSRPDSLSDIVKHEISEQLNAAGYIRDDENPENVLVVGGDGTFIYAVHKYIALLDTAKFFGIHTGTFGFFTDYVDFELDKFLSDFMSGECKEEKYQLLEVTADDRTFFALNEARIENCTRTQTIHVNANDIPFETFHGTGLCISTQLGSTAYNHSLGGAVIQEGLNLMQMTEISGIHHSKFRSLGAPIIMRDDVVLKLQSKDFRGAILGIDSDIYPLDDCTCVTIQLSKTKGVRMLKGRDVSYFKRLQSLF